MSSTARLSVPHYERGDVLAAIGEQEFAELLGRYGCKVRGHRSRCPAHGGDNQDALHFNRSDGVVLFNCFTKGCGGTAIDLVMVVEGRTFREALTLLAEQLHVAPRKPGEPLPPREAKKAVRPAPDPLDPARVARMQRILSALARRSEPEEDYLKSRGIPFREGLCYFNQGGTSDAEVDRLAARGYRIAVSLRNPKSGEIVSFQFRRVRDGRDGHPKVMTLEGPLNGAVFGSVAKDIKPNEPLLVTEGLTDTLAALSAGSVRTGGVDGAVEYLRVVGFSGATLAHKLIEGFGAQLPGRDVLIALDGDGAGEKPAPVLARELVAAGAKPYRVRTTTKDLADELANACKAGESAGTVLLRLFDAAIRADEYADLKTGAAEKHDVKSPLRSFTLAQLRARPQKTRELIVAPFMGRAESTFFYGPKGHGKTWAALGAAVVGAAGNGAQFLNFRADGPGVPTLYVDAEMFEHDIRLRLDDICRTGNLDPGDNLFIWTPDAQLDGTPLLNLMTEEGRQMLEGHIDDIRAETGKAIGEIYFDNLATLLHGWLEKDAESWNPVLQWTLALRARQIGNNWVHHSNRTGGYRGSSAIVTTMHAIIKIAHPEEGYSADMGAWFDLTYEYTRAKPESGLFNINARLEGDVWTFKEAAPDHDELIRILFGQGLSMRAIAEQIEGTTKSSIERAVRRMKLQRTP